MTFDMYTDFAETNGTKWPIMSNAFSIDAMLMLALLIHARLVENAQLHIDVGILPLDPDLALGVRRAGGTRRREAARLVAAPAPQHPREPPRPGCADPSDRHTQAAERAAVPQHPR